MNVLSFIGAVDWSITENICHPTQPESAPFSAWKIQERMANASEIRMPTELGIHMEEASTTTMIGPAINAPNTPATAISGSWLSIMLPVCHEPSTSTQAPTITAVR